MGYIYKITNQINNKIYIGKTIKSIKERFNEHKKKASTYPNRYLYDAMNHYGYDNFTIEVIEECLDEYLNEREIYWIATLQSNNSKIGYNLTIGGDGGNTWERNSHKLETGDRIRQSNLKEKYIPMTKESLQKDIDDGLTYRQMMEKYHTSTVTLANRMREFFGGSLREIRPVKNSGQFVARDIPIEEFYDDIKENILTNKEICQKYQIGETTFYTRCKKFFNKTPNQIRKGE